MVTIVKRVLKFYQFVFLIFSYFSFFCFVIGTVALVADKYLGKPENFGIFIWSYGVFLTSGANFSLWSKIFSYIHSLILDWKNLKLLKTMGKLLYWSFVLNIIQAIYSAVFSIRSPIDFKNPIFPNATMTLPRYCLAVFQVAVKYFAAGSEFFLPMTYGAASLFIGMLISCYVQNLNSGGSNG